MMYRPTEFKYGRFQVSTFRSAGNVSTTEPPCRTSRERISQKNTTHVTRTQSTKKITSDVGLLWRIFDSSSMSVEIKGSAIAEESRALPVEILSTAELSSLCSA